jgi:hypothetical protein
MSAFRQNVLVATIPQKNVTTLQDLRDIHASILRSHAYRSDRSFRTIADVKFDLALVDLATTRGVKVSVVANLKSETPLTPIGSLQYNLLLAMHKTGRVIS